MLTPFNNAGLFGILLESCCHTEGTFLVLSVKGGIFSFIVAFNVVFSLWYIDDLLSLYFLVTGWVRNTVEKVLQACQLQGS
jgi:hypothetical protein